MAKIQSEKDNEIIRLRAQLEQTKSTAPAQNTDYLKDVKTTLEVGGEDVQTTLEAGGEDVQTTLETGGEDVENTLLGSLKIR
jgi:hypothetical protein